MNIPPAANSNVLPFALSRHAEMPRPTPRYRADRLYVDLVPTRAIQPGWKRCLHWFGVISFFAIAFTLAVS